MWTCKLCNTSQNKHITGQLNLGMYYKQTKQSNEDVALYFMPATKMPVKRNDLSEQSDSSRSLVTDLFAPCGNHGLNRFF